MWIAVDKDGTERTFPFEPFRLENNCWNCERYSPYLFTILPKGSIKKLIGRNLTWEDNPVELKEK